MSEKKKPQSLKQTFQLPSQKQIGERQLGFPRSTKDSKTKFFVQQKYSEFRLKEALTERGIEEQKDAMFHNYFKMFIIKKKISYLNGTRLDNIHLLS